MDSMESRQAIEGLALEDRQRIKQLCQEWWDSSNEDHSFFRMALQYQGLAEQEQLNSTTKEQSHGREYSDTFSEANGERAVCMH